MTGRYRPRRQFKFLLYQDIEVELVLTEFILKLKQSRQFVTVLKNSLRLMGSLMEKDLSVLYELFPWIETAILANAPKTSTDDADLKREIADLKLLILQRNGDGIDKKAPLVAAPPLKQSGIAPPALVAKNTPVADASVIADNFLDFIQ